MKLNLTNRDNIGVMLSNAGLLIALLGLYPYLHTNPSISAIVGLPLVLIAAFLTCQFWRLYSEDVRNVSRSIEELMKSKKNMNYSSNHDFIGNMGNIQGFGTNTSRLTDHLDIEFYRNKLRSVV